MAFKTTVVLLAFMASARLVHSTFFDTSNTNYEISSKLRNATDIQFPLQSGEVNGRMVIVDSRYNITKIQPLFLCGRLIDLVTEYIADKESSWLVSIGQEPSWKATLSTASTNSLWQALLSELLHSDLIVSALSTL
jgi:hypothetical protein